MTDQRRISIVGAAASGKTTYAGRLWIAFRAKNARLKVNGLPEHLRPLKHASEPLNENVFPQRTGVHVRSMIQVPLLWSAKQSQLPFQLEFMDYSGEELELIFHHRDAEWSGHWVNQAKQATGLLLLVRSNQILKPSSNRLHEPPPDIDPDQPSFDALHQDAPSSPSPAPATDDPEELFGAGLMPTKNDTTPADPHASVRSPTEVALIEVLQFFRHERGLWMGESPDPHTLRVAVALSCWDAIPGEWKHKGPEPYLQRHFPLLHDFLLTNFDPNGIAVFGLSSTGGDLNNDAFRQKYSEAEPGDMGEIAFHSPRGSLPQSSPDITLPLGWLLEGDAVFPPA